MWSEEELREVEPGPVTRNRLRISNSLRREISQRSVSRIRPNVDEITRGEAVIYSPVQGSHGNFIDASYSRILANSAWSRRLDKAHTAKRQARPTGVQEETRDWHELDAATSSDALLMNIFCYPRLLHRPSLCTLLGIDNGVHPIFGVRSLSPMRNGRINTTEIDMQLGDLLVEAKLTETHFQSAPLHLVERYSSFDDVFDRTRLLIDRRGVTSYQLIRGVLAAQAVSARFCAIVDARSPHLREAWYSVIAAVRSFDLQSRLRLLTWQEISRCAPLRLRAFLRTKYGIE